MMEMKLKENFSAPTESQAYKELQKIKKRKQ
jgi:hypothetical protein